MARLRITFVAMLVIAATLVCSAQSKSDKSVTVVFKDGHQRTFQITDVSRIEFKNDTMLLTTRAGRPESIPVADIARMDFAAPGKALPPLGRNHFVGKWEVGEGVGRNTFTITLDPDGHARKSIGASHGTWVLVDNEARISWDDGWHDAIRKVDDKHEKFAYEPGKSFSDEPSNVTDAKRANPESM
jgi:hypothetical protein